jgi:hypothetical protein
MVAMRTNVQDLSRQQLNESSNFDLTSDMKERTQYEQMYNASINQQLDDDILPMIPFDQKEIRE